MCLGAQAKMSHEMCWWKSEDLQHFPWCWVCMLASSQLQHAKAGAFKTEHSKMVTVSLLWGTAAGFHQAVPRSLSQCHDSLNTFNKRMAILS